MKPGSSFAFVTSFVGREADLAAIDARLDEGRLVTVLGPGGMGKTRLAQRFVAERAAATFAGEGGVWLCDLSEAKSSIDIVSAVASALGVPVEDSGDLGRAIARRGRVLLVIDNFDRLVAHARATVGAWMRAAPSARFLVTSRAALGIEEEQLWPLEPLGIDEAITLFTSRARLVQPRFDAEAERGVVERIVRAVDCMPLALELAATRMSVLSATELEQRLSRPLDVLSGKRDIARHSSMRRAIVDSLDVLDDEAKRVFAAASQLRNRFTTEAAEEILGDVVVPKASVLDVLDSLVRASLLRVTHEPGDVARYAFFEAIRDVADELAGDAKEREAIRGRAVTYYAKLTPRAADLDNLVAAQGFAVELARAREAVAIALRLEGLLSSRGMNRQLVALFDGALDACERAGVGDEAMRAEVHLARGLAHLELGPFEPALADFTRAKELAERANRPDLSAVALARLGALSDIAGDTAAARARFEESLRMLAALPASATKTRREAEAHLGLGHALRREGNLVPAREAIVRAIERHRALENAEGLAAALYEIAVVEMFAGDHAAAFARFEEGLEVARAGDIRLLAGALETARGSLLQDLGRLDEALEAHARAARVFHELGSRYREASALYYLATTYLERGEPAETIAIARRARGALGGVGAKRYEALIAACMASAHAARGDLAPARAEIADAERAAAMVKNEPALATTVALQKDAVEHRGAPRGAGRELLARAEERVGAHATDDSRFALRVLRAAVEGHTTKRDEREALVVAADGSEFRAPRADVVELPARSPLRRILAHLVERRIAAPGETVAIDDIIRAGWGGEKMNASAALNRANVALASLRKMGLRGVLVKTAGGYALSETIALRVKGD